MKFRLPRFSMRSLVIAMLLLGAGLGLVGRELYQIRTKAEAQRAFVAQLKSKGVWLVEEDRKDLTILESLATWIEGNGALSFVSEVTLRQSGLPEEEVIHIARLEGLKSLTDQGANFSDKTLAVLGENLTLHKVILYNGWQGTEAGATALVSGKAPLVSISLQSCTVNEEFITRAADLRSLEHLQVDAKGLSSKAICRLRKTPNLTQLILTNAAGMGPAIEAFSDHPSFRNWVLYDYTFNGGELEPLRKSAQIERLIVTTKQFPFGILQSTSEMKGLLSLALRGALDEEEQLRPFQSAKLEMLGIEGLPKQFNGTLDPLAHCKSLKNLLLADVSLTDQEFEKLAAIQSLQSIVMGAGVSPEAVSRLQQTLPQCSITMRHRDGRMFLYKPGGQFELRQPPPILAKDNANADAGAPAKP